MYKAVNITATKTNLSRSDSEKMRNPEEISNFRSYSEEISDSGSLLAQMRRHLTFTPVTVFENIKRVQDFSRAAATTVETIHVDKSVWNHSV